MGNKYFFCLLIGFCFSLSKVFAQIPDGSVAPDWTLTDINKNVWHLYDLTAKGKTVFIDFSTTWCGPCFSYHKRGFLDSLYLQHGPNGTIDQSCYVFLIEGDARTNYNDLIGKGTHTQGNWILGTVFPIIDPGYDTISPLEIKYDVPYFPMIYMICPNNKIYHCDQLSNGLLFEKSKASCITQENNKWKGFGFNSEQTDFTETVSKTKEVKSDFLFLFRKRLSILRTPNC